MDQPAPPTVPTVESPPPAPRPPDPSPDPRRKLHDLAATLTHHPDPRAMSEYLTLRRKLR